MNFLNILTQLLTAQNSGGLDFSNFQINYEALTKALSITGTGMVGVFVITVVIIIVVNLLNKFTNR
ncbi:MAG: hypothetical protein E7564_08820 [Ruminococcaceae bacterium]|nr:hypothetical protein [Oscillospiraceae bacterium]